MINLNNLWSILEKNKYGYMIVVDSAIYMIDLSDVHECAAVRFFVNRGDAENYMYDLIEREQYRPSELSIVMISTNQIFDLKQEFEITADEIYGLPVKIILTNIRNGIITNEDVLYDSTATIH